MVADGLRWPSPSVHWYMTSQGTTATASPLMTPAEIARLAHVSKATVYREIDRGELRARQARPPAPYRPGRLSPLPRAGGHMSGVITLRPADGAHERKRRMRGAAPGEPFASSGAQRGNVPRVGRRGRAIV